MATPQDKSSQSRTKPLLFGTTYAEDIERLTAVNEIMENDAGYIPGYSEQVRANEIANIDPTVENFTTSKHIKINGLNLRDHYIKMYGTPKPLPVRFKWVRVEDQHGDDNTPNIRNDLLPYMKDGYKFVKTEDMEALSKEYGYGMPPAGVVAPDGTIRRGDVALVVVDAEGAARADARKARENAEREAGSGYPGISVERNRESNYVPSF